MNRDDLVAETAGLLTEHLVWNQDGQPDKAMHDKTLAMAELAVTMHEQAVRRSAA